MNAVIDFCNVNSQNDQNIFMCVFLRSQRSHQIEFDPKTIGNTLKFIMAIDPVDSVRK